MLQFNLRGFPHLSQDWALWGTKFFPVAEDFTAHSFATPLWLRHPDSAIGDPLSHALQPHCSDSVDSTPKSVNVGTLRLGRQSTGFEGPGLVQEGTCDPVQARIALEERMVFFPRVEPGRTN